MTRIAESLHAEYVVPVFFGRIDKVLNHLWFEPL